MSGNSEKKMKESFMKKWMVLLFIGPGLFFIFYWMITQGDPEAPTKKFPLPNQYYSQGKMVELDGGKVQAGLEERTIQTRKLLVGKNNQVVAETGKIFLVVPIFTQAYKASIEDFNLVDTRGIQYNPLDIKKEYISQVAELKKSETPQKMSVQYLLFRVEKDFEKDIEEYYLILHGSEKDIAWKFEA